MKQNNIRKFFTSLCKKILKKINKIQYELITRNQIRIWIRIRPFVCTKLTWKTKKILKHFKLETPFCLIFLSVSWSLKGFFRDYLIYFYVGTRSELTKYCTGTQIRIRIQVGGYERAPPSRWPCRPPPWASPPAHRPPGPPGTRTRGPWFESRETGPARTCCHRPQSRPHHRGPWHAPYTKLTF